MVAGAAAVLDPNAEAHAARCLAGRRASGTVPIAEALDDLVEALRQVAVHAAVARLEGLTDREQVLAAKIIGVDPEPAGDHVDLRLRGEARLGSAKAAKRTGRHRIGA